MAERFKLAQFERYDLHSQLLDHACRVAVEEGIISQAVLNKFVAGGTEVRGGKFEANNLLYMAMQFRAAQPEQQAELFGRLRESAKLTADEQLQLANLIDLLVPVVNAANSLRETHQPNGNANEVFKNYLISGLKIVGDGKNAFGMRPDEWLDTVAAAKSQMILSLVNTAHPTNFHTPFGREYEKGMITLLHSAKIARDDVVPQAVLTGAYDTQLRSACHRMKNGETITYIDKVTVGEETETEKDVLRTQKEIVPQVLQSWNLALMDKDVGKAAKAAGADCSRKLSALMMRQAEKEKAYEQRSWIRAGADKDGREESTDVAFYAGYKSSLNEQTGVYEGPILDLRDNAEVRKKLINALVARQYGKNEEFRGICNHFCSHVGEQPLGEHWKDHSRSVFQHLSQKNQSAFLQHLMGKGVNLFNRRGARTEAVGFNEAYYEVYGAVLKDYSLNKHTPFWALTADQRDDLLRRMSKVKGKVEVGQDVEHSEVKEGGYRINRVHNAAGDITGFNYNHVALGTFLTDNQPTTNGNGATRPLNDEESLACMAYLRRLFLVNKFVDEQKGKAVVVEREQAANFENASDFFAQLYLYQQAGLVTIENGKVAGGDRKPKIGIMPLFETTPEMKRGPQIVGEILASPLGESYYRARGKAEFMVGYSDGAKSGGNFASHVRIMQFERAVTAAFKQKFGEDFEVRILRGPGRGENRGGLRRYDRQYLLHHDSVNKSAVCDQTLQGDLIIRMQMDPVFAERTLAEITVSALAGAVEARRQKSKLENQRIASFEAAVNYLADHSEEHYRKGVFDKTEEASAFIQAVIKNPKATSRRAKRENTTQKGLGPERAIPVEYAANIACLPLHDYGFNQALSDFASDNNAPAVLDENGRPARGEKALKILARDCPFFREEMKLCALRQQSFMPVLVDLWAQKASQPDFVNTIKSELTGLGDRCQTLLSGKKTKMAQREDYSGEPFAHALSDVVQAILAGNDTVDEKTGHRLYMALQAPVSERPAGPMEVEIPSLSLGSKL